MSSSSSSSRNTKNRAVQLVRSVVLLVGLGGAFWLGVKALREAPEAGSGGPPPSQASGPPPASVFVGPVVEVEAREKQRVTGNLRAVARAKVAARESGAVEKILVDEGDVVKEGQVLTVLDGRRIEAEIAEASSSITAAEVLVTQRNAEAKRADSDFTMKTGLFAKRAVSQRELLDAEREKLVAAAQVKAASDQLNMAKSRLALLRVRETDLEIRAPFDGRIVERNIEPGEWLAAGSPVVSLVSTGEIEAWLDVPERYSASISSDPTALQVFAEGGDLTTAAKSVKRIAEVNMRSRLFQVVATLDDHDGRLIHGMSVHADVPVGSKRKMLAVPVNAVISSTLGDYVFRAGPTAGDEGALPIAEKIAVQVQFRRDGLAYIEQSKALAAGDRIVLEGNERLRAGQPLMISQNPKDGKPEVQVSIKP